MVASSTRAGLARAAALGFVVAVALMIAGVGVVYADTQQPTQVEGSNNVVLLVAALGVLIGVLIVARPRRGPKS